jgi:hypothetical protein
MPKRKTSPNDTIANTSSKKRTGKVSILSANTCGFNREKWDNLQGMADSQDIDIIFLQESLASKAEVEAIVGTDYEVIVTSEKPTAKEIDGKPIPVATGMNRSYAALIKKSSDITLTPKTFAPDTSESVKRYVRMSNDSSNSTPSACSSSSSASSDNVTNAATRRYFAQRTGPPINIISNNIGSSSSSSSTSLNDGLNGPRRSTRKSKPRLDQSKVDSVGLRAPQVLQMVVPGRQPVDIYNYHAPQGGGTGNGMFSGMQAKMGHEIVRREMQDNPTTLKMVIGDQNAQKSAMRNLYPTQDIISAGGGDLLTHAAVPRGLQAERIDLGEAGAAFNNKGQKGCSDHSPVALIVNVPK